MKSSWSSRQHRVDAMTTDGHSCHHAVGVNKDPQRQKPYIIDNNFIAIFYFYKQATYKLINYYSFVFLVERNTVCNASVL